MWRVLLTIIILSAPSFVAQAEEYFHFPGPNCFGTALKKAGVYDHIRGVDVEEFGSIIENHCQPKDTPEPGDIGVFAPQGSRLYTHAFVFIDSESAFEKQGVDYIGQTPARQVLLSQVIYRSEASPECRQWGDFTCFSELTYYSCTPVSKPQSLVHFEQTIENILRGQQSANIQTLDAQLAQLKKEGLLQSAVIKSLEKQLHFFRLRFPDSM